MFLYLFKETVVIHTQNDKGNLDVEIKTLDSFNLEDIDYIKIDANHEIEVVEGAKTLN